MKFGLLGNNTHSLSPQIHQHIFDDLGTNDTYTLLAYATTDMDVLLQQIEAAGFAGINVTIPYKTEVIPFLDQLSPAAQTIGAVNTIVFAAGKRYGYNTDYDGFHLALQAHGVNISGKTCVVLGTGGASRAIVALLHAQGAKNIRLISRQPLQKKADCLYAEKWGGHIESYAELYARPTCDILVNATPVGMYPQIEESPLMTLPVGMGDVVIDIIYRPQETRLLQQARQQGKQTINGMYMLVAQALRAEEIWQKRTWHTAYIQYLVKQMEQINGET